MYLNETYWTERYLNNQTGWDIGYPSPAIVEYFNQMVNKDAKILFPGGGNGYEAQALFNMGFTHVYLLDLAYPPLKKFAKINPTFPKDQLIHTNFFEHNGQYDYIVEQTFFCAISPNSRQSYVDHMNKLLKPKGKLIGLLFNTPLNSDHPPFGGEKTVYQKLFSPKFEILKMDKCENSIQPRQGNELFIELQPLKI